MLGMKEEPSGWAEFDPFKASALIEVIITGNCPNCMGELTDRKGCLLCNVVWHISWGTSSVHAVTEEWLIRNHPTKRKDDPK